MTIEEFYGKKDIDNFFVKQKIPFNLHHFKIRKNTRFHKLSFGIIILNRIKFLSRYLVLLVKKRNSYFETTKNLKEEKIKSYDMKPVSEIPKGRPKYSESNIVTAVREVYEETGFRENVYEILPFVGPIKEKFIGSDGITYVCFYYIALLKNKNLKNYRFYQNKEIKQILWTEIPLNSVYTRPSLTKLLKKVTKILDFFIN